MLSVVIRCKNEARWIGRCLFALAHQRRTEIEPVVVDNNSTDGTREVAEQAGARIVPIGDDEFSFGRAINRGFEVARHENVAILSAHCLPVDELWADYLVAALQAAPGIAGAYGRQEPLPDTSDFDKRDLWLTFRDQRLHQTQDAFFHNANWDALIDVLEPCRPAHGRVDPPITAGRHLMERFLSTQQGE